MSSHFTDGRMVHVNFNLVPSTDSNMNKVLLQEKRTHTCPSPGFPELGSDNFTTTCTLSFVMFFTDKKPAPKAESPSKLELTFKIRFNFSC